MYGTLRGTSWGYSLWEFQVYGPPAGSGGGTPANLALNRAAAASSVEGPGLPAANAVDGNPGTRWSSRFSDAEWIAVDPGSVRSVGRVRADERRPARDRLGIPTVGAGGLPVVTSGRGFG
jgi:hypothetical protein